MTRLVGNSSAAPLKLGITVHPYRKLFNFIIFQRVVFFSFESFNFYCCAPSRDEIFPISTAHANKTRATRSVSATFNKMYSIRTHTFIFKWFAWIHKIAWNLYTYSYYVHFGTHTPHTIVIHFYLAVQAVTVNFSCISYDRLRLSHARCRCDPTDVDGHP